MTEPPLQRGQRRRLGLAAAATTGLLAMAAAAASAGAGPAEAVPNQTAPTVVEQVPAHAARAPGSAAAPADVGAAAPAGARSRDRKAGPRLRLATHPTKILTFVEENHSLAQMRAGMPYLNSLARRYAYSTGYTAIRHPSLPNYIAITGGSTFGITRDVVPSATRAQIGRAPSVFDQALAHGRTAKTYAESMPTPCALKSDGLYVVRHNPWAYFEAGRRHCNRFDVRSGTPASGPLARDIRQHTLPNVGMVIPNLCNDAHDCSLGRADSWLKGWLPMILHNSAFTSGRLVVVVTADEGLHKGANKILTVVLHAGQQPGRVVRTPLTHYSLSRLYSQLAGAPPLRLARDAPDMAQAYHL